ncbi:unnamed protein product [Ectocarpus sp. 13 AM-2016]
MQLFKDPAFLKRQRTYNNMFAFTCLGTTHGKTWTQLSYPSMLKLYGRLYHRVMDSFRGSYNDTVSNNARMYIYDHDLQTKAKTLHLDSDTVKFIADMLRKHNCWVKQYRALLVVIDDSDSDNMSISFEQSSPCSTYCPDRNRRIAVRRQLSHSRRTSRLHVPTQWTTRRM